MEREETPELLVPHQDGENLFKVTDGVDRVNPKKPEITPIARSALFSRIAAFQASVGEEGGVESMELAEEDTGEAIQMDIYIPQD